MVLENQQAAVMNALLFSLACSVALDEFYLCTKIIKLNVLS